MCFCTDKDDMGSGPEAVFVAEKQLKQTLSEASAKALMLELRV